MECRDVVFGVNYVAPTGKRCETIIKRLYYDENTNESVVLCEEIFFFLSYL